MKAGLCLWNLREIFYCPWPRANPKQIYSIISMSASWLFSDLFFLEGKVSQKFYLYEWCACTCQLQLLTSASPRLCFLSSDPTWLLDSNTLATKISTDSHQLIPSFCSCQAGLPSFLSFLPSFLALFLSSSLLSLFFSFRPPSIPPFLYSLPLSFPSFSFRSFFFFLFDRGRIH